MEIQRYKVCLSIQRGLLDKITSNLRLVYFVLEKDVINVYFVYDTKPSELEEELVGDASVEIIADFPASYMINCELIETKYPEKIAPKGQVIFSRFED